MSEIQNITIKDYAGRSNLVHNLQEECDRAQRGEKVDLNGSRAKVHALVKRYDQDNAAIGTRSIGPKLHAARLAHRQELDELTARINTLFEKTNSIPAWVKPAACTAVAIATAAVTALIFSKFNVTPLRTESFSKLSDMPSLTPSVNSLGIPTITALTTTAPIDLPLPLIISGIVVNVSAINVASTSGHLNLSGPVGHEGIPNALPALVEPKEASLTETGKSLMHALGSALDAGALQLGNGALAVAEQVTQTGKQIERIGNALKTTVPTGIGSGIVSIFHRVFATLQTEFFRKLGNMPNLMPSVNSSTIAPVDLPSPFVIPKAAAPPLRLIARIGSTSHVLLAKRADEARCRGLCNKKYYQ